MKTYKLLYDAKLKRPGCVLLQALVGGTVPSFDLHRLGEWLVERTPDMAVYDVTEEQLEALKRIADKKHGERRKR